LQIYNVSDIIHSGGDSLSKKEKLIERFKSKPKDFTFDEMQKLLEALGYQMSGKGKTSGSRVKFSKGNKAIILHKPHPRKELREYQIKQALEVLEKEGLI
jgi:predicted RNA binding protein YcfA (HicA-like mRNA interferase family)